MADDTTDPDVSLDLDTLDREGRAGPYTVRLGGHVYTLQDPVEIDYRELMSAYESANSGQPHDAVGIIIADPQERDAFFLNPLPTWKLEKLFNGWIKHYGLPGGKAPRASRSSSRGTARR